MPKLSELVDTDYLPAAEPIPADIPRVYIGNGNAAVEQPLEMPSPTSSKINSIINSLFRDDDKRYQLWPEKVIREGLTGAGDVASGKVPTMAIDPATGDVHTSPQMIEKAQAISALAGTGGLGGVTDATLGATPFLRPALKYKDKLYKGKEGQQHQDVIPDALYPEFNKMAMSGEDISHYNFGFVNDKGHFLNREDALKYGIDTGIIDPQAGKFGALTSTLMADSSKPGTAIEALAKAGQDAFHGTATPGFTRFNTPDPGQYMPDRALGIHVSKDPEIANTFVKDNGAVYPVKIPQDAKFYNVKQDLLPYIEDKTTAKHVRNVISDQNAIETAIYRTAYKKDPAMFARFLEARWNMKKADAEAAAKNVLSDIPQKFMGRPVKGLDDYIAHDGVVKSWNETDRAKATEIFKKDLQDKGYAGVKYINTSPMETANAKDHSSYIVFNPSEHVLSKYTNTLMADSSKPGTAIEAMAKTKYPLAKPSERFTNTLGQNDNLIQNMTPDEFLKISRPLKIDAESRETINNLKQHIKEGKPLDPLELHANGKEDGRHRAIAAKELGIKEVPVINFRPPAEPFYSALEHNVSKISQNKMTGDQWLGTLSNKPGVKPEEMQWTGLGEFLKENGNKPVTKAQIEEHLAGNKVELKEVSKGASEYHKLQYKPTLENNLRMFDSILPNFKSIEDIALAKQHNPQFRETVKGKSDQEIFDAIQKAKVSTDYPSNLFKSYDTLAEAEAARKAAGADEHLDIRSERRNSDAKYHSYQLPGGENYREMLLTLPKKAELTADGLPRNYNLIDENAEAAKLGFKIPEGTPERWSYRGPDISSQIFKTREEAVTHALRNAKQNDHTGEYRSSHWDEPNILAHVRMNDRTIDGKKSLHLEEIQSDWHQQGRDKGYRPEQEKKLAELVKQREDLQKEASALGSSDARYKEIYKELPTIQTKINEIGSGNVGVPDAPFKKSWHELALKRMIREAAEKGYDRLSWTPGEAQALRYPNELRKAANSIEWHNKKSGKVDPEGSKQILIDTKTGEIGLSLNKDGIITSGPEGYKGKNLSEVIGKEMTSDILSKNEGNIAGKDFVIGGEGMKGFYDKMIPNYLEKLGKEHGVKVKSHMLETNPKGWHITPPSETVSGEWMVKSNDYNSKGFHFKTKEEAEANLAQNIAGERAAKPIHYIDIPQSLKDSAMHKGFPLFSSTHMFTPISHDPFEKKK